MQQSGGTNEVLRFEPLGEFVIDRRKQLEGLTPTAMRNPVPRKIRADTQLVGQGPYRSRFDKRFLQQFFSPLGLACMEQDRRMDPQQLRTAPTLTLLLLVRDRSRHGFARLIDTLLS